ncbi:MAG: two-component system, NarL family, nitrate/nitrite response regulator NarL [Nocardioidaceae bacterium]|nr:two-component system, NarL family, nitrate/nitrite response regulator NarL [Nocardioidaceae bacterium]
MSLVLCDDHAMFLDSLADALHARGHRVAALTSDPEELPGLVRLHQPTVVLLDVHLPSSCGVTLARQLREDHPGTLIVLLTGSTEAFVRAAYDDGTVDGLVNKGTALRNLDAALARVLAGERVLVGWPAAVGPVRRTTDLDLLTERERQVLELITDGVPTAMMAQRLGVSVNTVRTHVRSVLHKLGVHQRTKAARAAVELGLLAAG